MEDCSARLVAELHDDNTIATMLIRMRLYGFIFTWLENVLAPNELRIDAAERDKVKQAGASAAASIRVELSCTPETTNQLEIKAQVYAGKAQPSRESSKY